MASELCDGYITTGNPQQSGEAACIPPSSQHEASKGAEESPGAARRLKVPPNRRDTRKLFVGGLPQDITNEEFVEFFGQFGKLLDCLVMFDRDTGRSRGFGFVTYVDQDVSDYVLSLGDQGQENVGRIEMRDKWVEIKPAEPKPSDSNRRGKSHQRRSQSTSQFAATQFSTSNEAGESSYVPGVMGAANAYMYPVFNGNVNTAVAQVPYYPCYDGSHVPIPGIYGVDPSSSYVPPSFYTTTQPPYVPGAPAMIMAPTAGGDVAAGTGGTPVPFTAHPPMIPVTTVVPLSGTLPVALAPGTGAGTAGMVPGGPLPQQPPVCVPLAPPAGTGMAPPNISSSRLMKAGDEKV